MVRSLFHLYPNDFVEDVFTLDYDLLRKNGFEALIFDIDNTLVPHGADVSDKVVSLFKKLQTLGFKTLLLSNNSHERVSGFSQPLDTLFISDANKPSADAFNKAVEMLEIDRNRVVVIGDTTFTDIAGANRAHLKSILVRYIGYYENGKKGKKRFLEKILLKMRPLLSRKRSILQP